MHPFTFNYRTTISMSFTESKSSRISGENRRRRRVLSLTAERVMVGIVRNIPVALNHRLRLNVSIAALNPRCSADEWSV